MKHKTIDLRAEVKRAILPDGLNGFLFPLYEAISNAFHAIEERWGDKLEVEGRLEIEFDALNQTISVSDNGSGFSDKNLSAFLTPLTGNKYERGGKGFGRFMAFKVFNKVHYSAALEGGRYESYKYDPFSYADNLIDIASPEGAGKHKFEHGITVQMGGPLAEFSNYFYFDDEQLTKSHQPEDIVSSILDHFLIEFIQKKVPKHFLLKIQGAEFNLFNDFHEALSEGQGRTETLMIGEKEEYFTFNYFRVGVDQSKKHRLYFYADNRAASDLENISSGLNTKPFVKKKGSQENRYFYLVAVSSEFFVSSQSRDRITNLHGKVYHDGKKKTIKDHLIALSKKHILETEGEYTVARRAEMKGHVDHLIAIDPLLRRGLTGGTSEDFVKKRTITETKEQLAQDLFVERFRQKFDFSKLDENAPIDKLVDVVRNQIPEDAKEALAVYVAYRNNVIQLFRNMMDKKDGKVTTEDTVHQLIYPRYKDKEEVDYSAHNLWLLDDDLAYAEYISSDRTTEGSGRAKGDFAHDLLINNDRELMVVEMKRPQKSGYKSETEYSEEDEANTDNPVDQLKKQIAGIRKRKKIKTSAGREVPISDEGMVRGYVLADWNDNLQQYLKNEDFIISDFGGQMAYRYYSNLNVMIEVLAFDRLVDRASNRNEAFVQMLEGRSSYKRKPTSPLSN